MYFPNRCYCCRILDSLRDPHIRGNSQHIKRVASQITYSNVNESVQHHKHYVFDTLWSRAIPAKQRLREIEKGGATALSDETKIALDYQYQIFKKVKDSIEKDQINKIRSMLEPIIQKQSRDTKRQLEIIKQLQYQLKQLQKQVSNIQKSMRRTKKKR